MEWIKINNTFEGPECNGCLKELDNRVSDTYARNCSKEVLIMVKGHKNPMTGFLCVPDEPNCDLYWQIVGIGDASFEDITHYSHILEPPKEI